jgi:hypothetical protein
MFPAFNQANKAANRWRDRHGFEILQLPLKKITAEMPKDISWL